jgi:uncharacterized protein YfaA (DUF2138 family)
VTNEKGFSVKRIHLIFALVVVLVCAIIALGVAKKSSRQPFSYPPSNLMVDLRHPDGYIQTQSLSDLPKDLLTIPIARDVLTEDLAFYYTTHEDRMGLRGTLKRIAYEKNLQWSDTVIQRILDEPAQMAFWRDGKGALRHYALIVNRTFMTKIMEQLASIALNDTQLTHAGDIETIEGKLPLYALEINPRRTFLFLSHGDKLIVFSDPDLVFGRKNTLDPTIKETLNGWLQGDTLSKEFDAPSMATAKHTLIVRSSALALGYSPFIPRLKGLRFDFTTHQWSTQLWMNPTPLNEAQTLSDPQLWNAAPANPTMCVMLPMDWNQIRFLLAQGKQKTKGIDASGLTSPALACWYAQSSLYTPLFITRTVSTQKNSLTALGRFAIADKKLLTLPSKGLMMGGKTNPSTLGVMGEYLIFSPDRDLVMKTFDTIDHRFPNVTDQIKASPSALMVINPKPLSQMVQRAIMSAVNGSGDANLLIATQQLLPPKMEALGRYPSYILERSTLPSREKNWVPLEWKAGEASQ